MKVTTPRPEIRVRSVRLDAIRANPNNPRAEITPESVRELANSISATGLLQLPVVTEPEPGVYELRAGHRRVAALRLLDAGEVDVVVREDLDTTPLEVALAENGQREDLDPLSEAAAVAEVLRKQGGTHASAAKRLGRSVKWVARRANLSKLVAAVFESIKSNEYLRAWPAAWLEEIALLGPERQAALFVGVDAPGMAWAEEVRSINDLHDRIREELQTLSHAPWDLEDAESFEPLDDQAPAVPACSACPKASHNLDAAADLFGELVEGDPSELALAVCTDRTCYDFKLGSVLRTMIRAARHKYGDDLLIEWGTETSWAQRKRLELAIGDDTAKVLDKWSLQTLSKKKGGRPTLALFGRRAGKIAYRIPYSEAPRATAGKPKEKASLEDRVRRLAKRRTKVLLELVRNKAGEFDERKSIQSLEELLQLVHAYGTSPVKLWALRDMDTESLSPRAHRMESDFSFEYLRGEICGEVLANIDDALRVALYNREPEDLEEGRVAALALRLDWLELLRSAAGKVPVPRSLLLKLASEESGSCRKLLHELFPTPPSEGPKA